jgi:hypothetical protein
VCLDDNEEEEGEVDKSDGSKGSSSESGDEVVERGQWLRARMK